MQAVEHSLTRSATAPLSPGSAHEEMPLIPVHPYSDDHEDTDHEDTDHEDTHYPSAEAEFQHAQPRDVTPNLEELSPLLADVRDLRASWDQRSIIPPSSPHSISPYFQPLVTGSYPGYDIASLVSDLGLDISASERVAMAQFSDFCLSLSDIDVGYIEGRSVPQNHHVRCEIVRVIETLIHIIPSMVRATDNYDLHRYLNAAESLLNIIHYLSALPEEAVADSRLQ
jgi:hypothetical protein